MGIFSKEIGTMDDLFVHTLRDIYYAENQIVKALPDMTFSHSAHRTGRADRPHPPLGQELTPSPTARRAQADKAYEPEVPVKVREWISPSLRRLILCLMRNHRRNRAAVKLSIARYALVTVPTSK
jgi:hypothetical protein